MLVKDELLDKVVGRVREQLPEEQAPQVEEFVRQYYAWIPLDDLADRSPIDIYGTAVAHWGFARQRKPGSAKIRVFNPHFEEHGWQSTHTVVEVVNDDMPFLVDTTRMEINRQGHAIYLMVHPVMRVRRDGEGNLVEVLSSDVASPEADGQAEGTVLTESVIHVEVDRHAEAEALEEIRDGLASVFRDCRAAVEDWPGMRERIREVVENLSDATPDEDEDLEETRAFLRWI